MTLQLMHQRHGRSRAVVLGIVLVACSDATTPGRIEAPAMKAPSTSVGVAGDPNSAAGDVKAYISGWLDGKAVQLLYTRSYSCEQPPTSVAPSGCEIGALPE